MVERDVPARLITGYAHASLQDGSASMMKNAAFSFLSSKDPRCIPEALKVARSHACARSKAMQAELPYKGSIGF